MMFVEQRNAALELLRSEGLPTRKNEKWHYTDLKNILKANMLPSQKGFFSTNPIGHGNEIVLSDGILTALPLSPNANYSRIDVLAENAMLSDPIRQINTSYITDAAMVNITHAMTEPLIINNNFSVAQNHIGLEINLVAKSSATIIEHNRAEAGNLLTTSVEHLTIGEDAVLNYVILRSYPLSNIELQQLNARLEKNARFNLYVINIGARAKLRRQELNVSLMGPGADFQLRSINLLEQNAHNDISMDVRHIAPNTSSKEILRNVVRDSAFGAFQGIIKVDKIAQKTDAKMSCNTLVLSDNASFSAKPELEIFADDVACGHGATVAPLNTDLLFYLAVRGIDPAEAKGLLIKSFVKELLSENEQIEELVSNYIDNWTSRLASDNV